MCTSEPTHETPNLKSIIVTVDFETQVRVIEWIAGFI